MIDHIKYYIPNKENFVETIENSDKVDLRICINSKTGEILDKRIAKFKNMIITITKNRATLNGSIHKYYNILEGYGEQNYNDFSYCDYRYAINHLQNSFNIDYNNTYITNLEFGLNIHIDQDPQELIDNYILMYDNKLPNRNDKFNGKGDYLEFKKTDYSLKIYNKSKQNKLKSENILRVELKITGSRYLKSHFNIYSLIDVDRQRYKLLFNKLLEHFDKLLLVDSLSLNASDRIDEKMLFQNGINPYNWVNLKSKKSKRELEKFKSDFFALLKEYNLLKTKTDIVKLLKYKFNQLTNCDCETLKNAA